MSHRIPLWNFTGKLCKNIQKLLFDNHAKIKKTQIKLPNILIKIRKNVFTTIEQKIIKIRKNIYQIVEN